MPYNYRADFTKVDTKPTSYNIKRNSFLIQVTFVEFGSFFYNCPYREAEYLSMENDI